MYNPTLRGLDSHMMMLSYRLLLVDGQALSEHTTTSSSTESFGQALRVSLVKPGAYLSESYPQPRFYGIFRDCSKATGFSQPGHDVVMPGFVDGLRRGLHATYPAPGAHGSARASAPGRHSFASCDSAGCPAPPHSR